MGAETARGAKLNALQIVELLIGLSKLAAKGSDWRGPIQALHTALHELKKRHPELFARVWFAEHTIAPYSRGIDAAIASLGAAGLVRIENPDFKYLLIKGGDREGFVQHLQHLPGATLARMREVAEEFDEEVGALLPEGEA